METSVDIILLNYNTQPMLKNCIKSIEKHTKFPYRLIIIDNNSQDESKKYLNRLRKKDMTLVYNKKNLGVSKAWNQGIKKGKGKYILFLNPDTLVSPNWLTKIVHCAESDKKIAVVGTKQINEKGRIVHGGILEKNGRRINRGFGQKNSPNKFNKICDCVTVWGACLLIKRENIPIIGYFDEQYFMYAEETDYTFRARLLGFRVVYCPVTITHFVEGSPINDDKRRKIHQRSSNILLEKKRLISPKVLKSSKLIKGEKPEIYLVHGGEKHLIPNKSIIDRLNLNNKNIKTLPQKQVDKIPTGIIIYI